MTRLYLIVIQQAWWNESGHGVTFMPWDWPRTDRAELVAAAFDDLGHDDFNVATVEDGRVVAFGWGMEDFGPDEDGAPHGGYDLDEITRQCEMAVYR